MLLVIKSQLNRKMEEILFDYNHEERVTVRTKALELAGFHSLSLYSDFCKREKIMALRFAFVRYGFLAVHLTQGYVYLWISD